MPVTVDFEGGYSEDDDELAGNIARLLDLGVIGINFEDRVVKGSGLYESTGRRRASPPSAKRRSRRASSSSSTRERMCSSSMAMTRRRRSARRSTRAKAYAAAGASGFFIPGADGRRADRADREGTPLPVNVMVMDGVPANDRLAELGVARISYGPIPYIRAMKTLEQEAKLILSSKQA